jgi:flagellar protein FliJ
MPQFRFRLATLLRLRETVRDRRRVQLAESRRADADLAGQLERLAGQQQRLEAERRQAAGPGSVDAGQLLAAHRYAVALEQQKEDVRQRRQTLAVEIDRRRQALLAADRDVQVLEKLRERRDDQHRREEERRAARLLDEAALQAAGR